MSFAATVYPHMDGSNGVTCYGSSCHNGSLSDSRRFTNVNEAYAFATGNNRTVANNPSASLFFRKPTGDCTIANPCSGSIDSAATTFHTGGTRWGNPSAGRTAAINWINGGLGARREWKLTPVWAAKLDGFLLPPSKAMGVDLMHSHGVNSRANSSR